MGENSGCLFLKIEKKKTPSEWLYTCAHMVAIPLNRVPVPDLCLRVTVGFPIFSPHHLDFHIDFSLAPARCCLKQFLMVFVPASSAEP